MNKTCCRCKVVKDISMFYRDKSRLGCIRHNCKECSNNMTKKWRENNPEKYKQICSVKAAKLAVKSKYRSRKNRHNMTNHYIRDLITMNTDLKPQDISIEIVKAWRINLKLKRELGLTRKLKDFK